MRAGVPPFPWPPLALAYALALAGCGYPEFRFDSELEGGVSDGTLDDASVDTGPLPFDSMVPDASDAKTDATDATDAKTDATDATDAKADATASAGCAAISADFCADFDGVTAVGAGFTNADVQGPGSLFLDPSGRSLPNAFLATAGVPATGTLCTAFLYKNFTAPAAKTPMRAEAWIKLDAATLPTSDGAAFLLKIERTGTTGDGVTVSIDKAGLFAERIGQTYARYPIAAKVKPGAWMRVRIDAVLHTTEGSLKVFVDDLTAAAVDVTGVSTVKADDDRRTLDVGLFVERASGAFAARFDDVSFAFR